MIKIEDLEDWASVECQDGKYRLARPLPGFLKERIKDAWEVFCGRAEALKTYDGSETKS